MSKEDAETGRLASVLSLTYLSRSIPNDLIILEKLLLLPAHKWLSGRPIENRPLRILIAEMSAPVEETLEEAGPEVEDEVSSSSSLAQEALRRGSTKSSEGSGTGPRFGISVLPHGGGISTPNLLEGTRQQQRRYSHRLTGGTRPRPMTREISASMSALDSGRPPRYPRVLPGSQRLSHQHDALPGIATQAGMFKQNSELNLNSSLTYLQIPQSKETEKLYKRTRSRKFVIDGEELVRHTEDLISVAEDSKTTYAQRVYRLRKEVEKEYTALRKAELKDQKKMMSRWKRERDDLLKTQRAEIEAIHKACNSKLDKTHKER
eukprot:sb/3466858/